MNSALKLPIDCAYLVTIEPFFDSRGCFDVFWDKNLLDSKYISFLPTSSHFSYNTHAKTLRGIHFQKFPYGQSKLVSCISGKVWDVMVDLRTDSSTFGKWHATEMSAASGQATLIPAGCGHGFVTLEPNTTIAYLIEGDYRPQAGRVLRWNDERLGIPWPVCDPILSDKDANAPGWGECDF